MQWSPLERNAGISFLISPWKSFSCNGKLTCSMWYSKSHGHALPMITAGRSWHWSKSFRSYFQAVHQKPYYRLNYLRKLFDQCQDRPAVIIGNAWPWDFEYPIEHVNLPLHEKDFHGEIKKDIPAFLSSGDHCIFLPPEAAYEDALLAEWQRKGYAMKMDAKLYRTLFARYDVRLAISSASADAGGVSFTLFRID